MRALKQLNQPIDSWGMLLIHIVVSRLDPETVKQWQNKVEYNEIPTWDKLTEFLLCRSRILETIEHNMKQYSMTSVSYQKPQQLNIKNHPKPTQSTKHSKFSKFNNLSTSFITTNKGSCIICSSNTHKIYNCEIFDKLSLRAKLDKVQELKLCNNCLTSGHLVSGCSSSRVCKTCKQRHHSKLHDIYSQSSTHQTLCNSTYQPNNMSQPAANTNHYPQQFTYLPANIPGSSNANYNFNTSKANAFQNQQHRLHQTSLTQPTNFMSSGNSSTAVVLE
jgi:hypothetical protein